MEEFALICICVAMFLGSYASGCVPLFFTFDEVCVISLKYNFFFNFRKEFVL